MSQWAMRVGLAVVVILAARGEVIAQQKYLFTERPLAVGDKTSQEVRFGVKIRTTAMLDGQSVASNRNMERRQQRQLELLPRNEPNVPRARVGFSQSEQIRSHATGIETRQPEPIAGKSYLIARAGDTLIVTNEAGEPVSDAESQMVGASMEAFGRPNPLAAFLNGRRIAVGEKLSLPSEVYNELFKSWTDMMEIEKFDLTLDQLEAVEGRQCGAFHAVIQGKSKENGQPMVVQGRMLIELATCRTAALEMSGAMSTRQTQTVNGQDVEASARGIIYAAMRLLPDRAR